VVGVVRKGPATKHVTITERDDNDERRDEVGERRGGMAEVQGDQYRLKAESLLKPNVQARQPRVARGLNGVRHAGGRPDFAPTASLFNDADTLGNKLGDKIQIFFRKKFNVKVSPGGELVKSSDHFDVIGVNPWTLDPVLSTSTPANTPLSPHHEQVLVCTGVFCLPFTSVRDVTVHVAVHFAVRECSTCILFFPTLKPFRNCLTPRFQPCRNPSAVQRTHLPTPTARSLDDFL
jgi:hypothetical protein